MIFGDDKMCASSFHQRPLNGLVDPLSFTAINFLRTYNRLLAPNEVAQCYNLSLLKEAAPRNLLHPSIPLQTLLSSQADGFPPICRLEVTPAQTTTTVTPANDLQQRDCIRHIPSPNNRVVVSSTCSSSPATINIDTDDIDAKPHQQQGFSAPLVFDQNSLDATSSLSPNFIRRQRGEKRPIPEEQKDEKYYERRKRNNEAAKKSRDARKMREDRIAFRAAILEQENAILRTQLIALRDEVGTLRQLLCSRSS